MKKEILDSSKELQEAINYFIDDIKNEMNIDITKEIIPKTKYCQFYEISDNSFEEYEVYDAKLFILAQELYAKGYNFLETAIEFKNNNLVIINQTLKEYVVDTVQEHQKQLTKENNNKQNITLTQ